MYNAAILALEDGLVLRGESFGAPGEVCAEVVFNTSLTGYQEIITDASYSGQMIVFTCAHIGNVGVNDEDYESPRAQCSAIIAREIERVPSNWRARQSLPDWLAAQNVVAIGGVDTRMLTRHLRDRGVMKGVVSTLDGDAERLIARARAWQGLEGRDMVCGVTCDEPYVWDEATIGEFAPPESAQSREAVAASRIVAPAERPLVIVYDYGVKRNILRRLVSYGCRVSVVPAATPAADVLAQKPAGVLLSNGPGDPSALPYAVDAVRGLLAADVPLFGICLGHQLLGQALGGRTYKLKFGHHGGNHPVQLLSTGAAAISAQNHNYAVAADSLDTDRVAITRLSLNDNSVEGLRLKDRPVFSVQYHPESSPGPHDSDDLFAEFVRALFQQAQTDGSHS